MILESLVNYYEELIRHGKAAPYGWANIGVSYHVIISENGELLDIESCRVPSDNSGTKTQPVRTTVPVRTSGKTSGIIPNFICDNAQYIFGIVDVIKKNKKEPDEEKREKITDRAKRCFKASRDHHRKILQDADSAVARAIVSYYEKWDYENAPNDPKVMENWDGLTDGVNLVFYVRTPDGDIPATEDSAVIDAWHKHYLANQEEKNAGVGQCLITGETGLIVRLHPDISGIKGALATGAKLVSFNGDSLCYDGKEQGANAPIGMYGAFAYSTALNTMLADPRHRRVIGDTTVVCWAENTSDDVADFGLTGVFGITKDNEGMTEGDVEDILNALAEGRLPDSLSEKFNPDQKFYMLGLAPNSARIVVRFFLQDTLGGFAKRLKEHEDRLEIIKPSYDNKEHLSIWDIARQTIKLSDQKAKPIPSLPKDIFQAAFTGARYPTALINGVNRRVIIEKDVTRARAAVIKAYYLRNTINGKTMIPKEVLTVTLNEESSYMPYVLGRLFSILDEVQEKAVKHPDSTIRKRYFSSACSTPAIVFPRLMLLDMKHLTQLNEEARKHYSIMIEDLLGRLHETYPARFTLPEQGAFQLGYYHQVQKRFTKKTEEETDESTEADNDANADTKAAKTTKAKKNKER